MRPPVSAVCVKTCSLFSIQGGSTIGALFEMRCRAFSKGFFLLVFRYFLYPSSEGESPVLLGFYKHHLLP